MNENFESMISRFAKQIIQEGHSKDVSFGEKTEAMKVLTSYYALLLKAKVVDNKDKTSHGFSFASTAEQLEEQDGGTLPGGRGNGTDPVSEEVPDRSGDDRRPVSGDQGA